jgi:co-chaperonin GroES (HSP10)
MKLDLTVVGPRVFVRPSGMPDMNSDGTLHLVHDRQNSTMQGVVVALGDGPRSRSGKTLAHVVAVGERVIFSPDKGQEIIFEKDIFVALDEDDILAVIE